MDVGVRIKEDEMLNSLKAYKACTDSLWRYLERDNDLFHRFLSSNSNQCQEEYQNFKNAALNGGLTYEKFLNNPNHN